MDPMTFTVTECPDGTLHVQNLVGMYLGQHHVHSKKGFEEWKKKAGPEAKGSLKTEKGVCNCGLKPGWVRECNGKDWFNANFGEDPEGVSESVAAVPVAQEPPKSEAPSPAPEKPPDKQAPGKGAEGDRMKYTATATVDGKKEVHEFEHDKASPWKIKDFAAKKFFAGFVKDKKPLEVWKAIDIKPVREKVERKAKAKKEKVKAGAGAK